MGRRPGWRRAASCRTPSDTSSTDPTSPNGSDSATRRNGRRTRRTARRCHDRPRRRADARCRRRRSGSTSTGPERAVAHEQRLVQPDRIWCPDPIDVVVDEGGAIGDHGVVDRVPITAQIRSNLADRAAVATDLQCRPPPGPIGHPHASRRDPTRPHRSMTRSDTTPSCTPSGACARSDGPAVRSTEDPPTPRRGVP